MTAGESLFPELDIPEEERVYYDMSEWDGGTVPYD